MKSRTFIPCLLVAASLLCANAGLCEDEDPGALFNEGVSLFQAQNFEEAVQKFRRANELQPTWKLYYNIGQCEAATKRYGMAIEAFERYISSGGDDVPEARREEVMKELRRLREMVGTLDVRGQDGVEIIVNGISRGTTPVGAGIRLAAGRDHHLSLKRDGREILTRDFFLGVDQTMSVDARESTHSTTAQPVDNQDVTGDGVEPATEGAPEPTPKKKKIKPAIFWVGVGATVAFGGATIGLTVAAKKKWDDANAAPYDESLRDGGKKIQAAGIAFLALTGVAAIATGVLAGFTKFKNDEKPVEQASMTVTPFAGNGSGGVLLSGTF